MSDTQNSPSVEFGFVAAMEREVSGIVRGWSVTEVQSATGQQRIYSNGKAALICAGTGVDRAYAAAKLLVEKCSPRMLISIGFAGACDEDRILGGEVMRPGAVLIPATVTEFSTGKHYAAYGYGHLVTLDRVAGKGLKQCTAARFGAQVVDMEAAGVGAAAVECGLEFAAIKAISDGVDEDLEFLAEFVKPEGFQTGRFIAHIAVRPRLWPRVVALQANSELAAKALKRAVESCMRTGFQRAHSQKSKEERVVEKNGCDS
jgi:nucleoside phosphorylase